MTPLDDLEKAEQVGRDDSGGARRRLTSGRARALPSCSAGIREMTLTGMNPLSVR
jgi:hypothetical protein